jgi:hypothetical protein
LRIASTVLATICWFVIGCDEPEAVAAELPLLEVETEPVAVVALVVNGVTVPAGVTCPADDDRVEDPVLDVDDPVVVVLVGVGVGETATM